VSFALIVAIANLVATASHPLASPSYHPLPVTKCAVRWLELRPHHPLVARLLHADHPRVPHHQGHQSGCGVGHQSGTKGYGTNSV
jgi:hypothetical protein